MKFRFSAVRFNSSLKELIDAILWNRSRFGSYFGSVVYSVSISQAGSVERSFGSYFGSVVYSVLNFRGILWVHVRFPFYFLGFDRASWFRGRILWGRICTAASRWFSAVSVDLVFGHRERVHSVSADPAGFRVRHTGLLQRELRLRVGVS